MSRGGHDLHGSAPDKSETALLLIDVINDFDFEEGEQLLRLAMPVGKNIADLKQRAKAEGGGKQFVEMLLPDEDDYFVLKPKHSGFYSTTLGLLLTHLAAKNLILTGIAGNNCVLFTANDAYMHDFKVFVPSDCVVSNTEEENLHALKQMETVLKADTTRGAELDLKAISG